MSRRCILCKVDDVLTLSHLRRLLTDSPVGEFRFSDGLIPEMLELGRPRSNNLRCAILRARVDDENLILEIDLLLVQCGEQLVQIVLTIIGGDKYGGFDVVSHDSA